MTISQEPAAAMKQKIDQYKRRVLEGGAITFEEAMELMDIDGHEEQQSLQEAAHEITLYFNSKKPGICSLVNAKSYLCGEDCGFCAQSVRFDTRADRYHLMKPEEALKAARQFEEKGVKDFCIVTSGGALTEGEFDQVGEIFQIF